MERFNGQIISRTTLNALSHDLLRTITLFIKADAVSLERR